MTYNRIKQQIETDNHTDRPHNHLQFPCDVYHTWTETKTLPNYNPSLLIAEDRPSWARRRYYLLATLLGLSSRMRTVVFENSKGVAFNLVKHVTKIEGDRSLQRKNVK